MVATLVEWAEFIHEHGVDAAVARVDTEKAAREAEKDRAALLAGAGRRRQPQRAAGRAHPQADRVLGRARPTIARWPRPPSSPRRRTTSPAGTRTSSPRQSWPRTARRGARWSSAPTATPSGSGCRPRRTCASRRPGAENCAFPLFIPQSYLAREADHVEGFSHEFWTVTHGGGKELEEPLIVRPTSETVIGEYMGKWIQSYRDLPLLLNLWNNVVPLRAAAPPVPAHHRVPLAGGPHRPRHRARTPTPTPSRSCATSTPTSWSTCSPSPCCPAARRRPSGSPAPSTPSPVEAMMGDGKALQMGTSHDLGQNFAKVFDITYLDANGDTQLCWTTSWGTSTRMVGGLIMAHGDDHGPRDPAGAGAHPGRGAARPRRGRRRRRGRRAGRRAEGRRGAGAPRRPGGHQLRPPGHRLGDQGRPRAHRGRAPRPGRGPRHASCAATPARSAPSRSARSSTGSPTCCP